MSNFGMIVLLDVIIFYLSLLVVVSWKPNETQKWNGSWVEKRWEELGGVKGEKTVITYIVLKKSIFNNGKNEKKNYKLIKNKWEMFN